VDGRRGQCRQDGLAELDALAHERQQGAGTVGGAVVEDDLMGEPLTRTPGRPSHLVHSALLPHRSLSPPAAFLLCGTAEAIDERLVGHFQLFPTIGTHQFRNLSATMEP